MVEKVKNLNWPLYSDIGLIFANIATVLALLVLAMNTKTLSNSSILIYYSILGLMVYGLLKLNHAASNE